LSENQQIQLEITEQRRVKELYQTEWIRFIMTHILDNPSQKFIRLNLFNALKQANKPQVEQTFFYQILFEDAFLQITIQYTIPQNAIRIQRRLYIVEFYQVVSPEEQVHFKECQFLAGAVATI